MYLFQMYPDADAIKSAAIRFANKDELKHPLSCQLAEPGLRKTLTKPDERGTEPFTLLATQLYAGLWFFRKVARDVKETHGQRYEASSEAKLSDKRDWGGVVQPRWPLLQSPGCLAHAGSLPGLLWLDVRANVITDQRKLHPSKPCAWLL